VREIAPQLAISRRISHWLISSSMARCLLPLIGMAALGPVENPLC
jgi:hypothetical protein